jgi:hypothetical protein
MKLTALAAVAVLALAGCSTGTGSAPLPQAPATSAPAAPAPAAPAPTAEAPVAEPVPAATTCDKAREAILTGTPSDITAAMKALVADKSAPATAREYARYYTIRDKDNKQLQEMDVSLIQMSCTV